MRLFIVIINPACSTAIKNKMKTKTLVDPGNNGNGKAKSNDLYFNVRILVRDKGAYGRIILYLETEGKKEEASSDYILRRGGVARTNNLRKIIELTKEVKEEIKSEIEKIVMRYSE